MIVLVHFYIYIYLYIDISIIYYFTVWFCNMSYFVHVTLSAFENLVEAGSLFLTLKNGWDSCV